MNEIEERIIATRDALADADKEFDTTVALLVATAKDSQYFGLIGQLGAARELHDQLKELISVIDYLCSDTCFDYESTGRTVDQFIKLKIAYRLFIKGLFEVSVLLTNAGHYSLSRACYQIRHQTIYDFAEIMCEND